MLHIGRRHLLPFLNVILLSTAAACGSSSPDAAPDDPTTGSAGSITMGSTGGDASASAGAGGTSAVGAAGHAGSNVGAGGSGGTPLVDAGSGGKSSATPTSDATIDIQPDGPWKVASLPAAGPGVVYLSDLTPTKVELFDKIGSPSKSGPMHNDVSFNGKPLVINGVFYEKGIGVHTYARITYSLGGEYKQFVSDTGLDFLEDSSTMIFEVEVDSKLVYDNGNGTKTKDQVAPVTLDVTGKSMIALYVRDGVDYIAYDFGVWGVARLLK